MNQPLSPPKQGPVDASVAARVVTLGLQCLQEPASFATASERVRQREFAERATAQDIHDLQNMLAGVRDVPDPRILLVPLLVAEFAGSLVQWGKPAEAAALYDTVLPLLNHPVIRAEYARCLMNHASALQSQGELVRAVKGYEEALPLLRQHAPPASVARCLMNHASAELQLDRLASAAKSLVESKPSSLPASEQAAYHSLYADVCWRLDRKEETSLHDAGMRKSWRRAQRQSGVDETTLGFLKDRQKQFTGCVARTLGRDGPQAAFDVIQEGKAAIFQEMYRRRGEGLLAESEEMGQSRNRLTTALRDPTRSGSAEKVFEDYLRVWQRDCPFASGDTDDLPPSSLERIQAALPSDWALLDFWRTANEEITVFVVFRDDLHVKKLAFPVASRKGFSIYLDRLQQSLSELPSQPHVQALRELYCFLFLPLRQLFDERGIRGLYLVPQGYLHALPLHACTWVEGGETWTLGDKYAISYLPVASLLPDLPEPRTTGPVLGLTNPERGTWHTLPFSDREGLILQQRFGGTYLHGSDATFAATTEWDGANLLHFSCHGHGNNAFAPLSHLRLADDLLLAHDVVYRRPRLRDGAMVILNGCQTAVRDWRAVDEAFGLTTAFLLRGAGLVLATQWSVIDACAAEMVVAFREALQAGAAPIEALRRAKSHVCKLDADTILGGCADVLSRFPASDFPHEAAKTHTTFARVCQRLCRQTEAEDHAERAARLLTRLGKPRDAEWLLEAVKSTRHIGKRDAHPVSFDHPIYWGAFHLSGRVT